MTAASPDPRDLPGSFRHRLTVDVRFADTDAQGHVNNAVYMTYCETARIRYWSDATGEVFAQGAEGAKSLILAEARITYRAQVRYGDVVTVESRATRIGRTSFSLEHRLLAASPDGPERMVAVGESVLVRFDYATQRSIPLSDAHIAALEAFEGRPLRGDAPA